MDQILDTLLRFALAGCLLTAAGLVALVGGWVVFETSRQLVNFWRGRV